MNKKSIYALGLASGIILGSALTVTASQYVQAILNQEIKVSLNGQVQEFKDATTGETMYPLTYKDRTYLPLRNVAELSGLDVDYDAETKMALLISNQYYNQNVKTIYMDAVDKFYNQKVWPNGDKIEAIFEDMNFYENEYAIVDVDLDGKDELILKYVTTSMADMGEVVWKYDFNAKKFNKLSKYFSVSSEFYKNGNIVEPLSHNQDPLCTAIWPYKITIPNIENENLNETFLVSSWDKSVSDTNYKGEKFPYHIDKDEDGIIYIIESSSGNKYLDEAEYNNWKKEILGDKIEIEFFTKMNPYKDEAIKIIRFHDKYDIVLFGNDGSSLTSFFVYNDFGDLVYTFKTDSLYPCEVRDEKFYYSNNQNDYSEGIGTEDRYYRLDCVLLEENGIFRTLVYNKSYDDVIGPAGQS